MALIDNFADKSTGTHIRSIENKFLSKISTYNMSKIKALFCSAMMMASCTAGNAAESQATGLGTLSLDDCLRIALSESPTVKVADMEVKRVDYSRRETIGQLLPSIAFSANYNRTLAKQTMYMNMDRFGGDSTDKETSDDDATAEKSSTPANGIKVGLDNSYSTGFSASLPLIAPQLWQSLKLADNQIARNIELARQSRLDLVNQVKNAYYTLLLALDSRRVIVESYDMARLNHEVYQKKYEVGAASDYDVLRTSVAMKNIEPELMQSEIAIKQARLQLLILMGLDTSVEFETATGLSDYEASMYETALNANKDYSLNTTLQLNKIDTDIADRNVKIQKSAYWPTLALSANYNWTSMSNGTPFRNFRWTPYSTVGLTLSIPLFEGGQRYNRVKQARLQAIELRLQRENLERSIASQVEIAVDNINVNVKQIASCSESVSEADRAHDIMTKSFEIGAASYLDLRDSELALTRARLARFQAIYNFLVANSDLELLLGNAPVDNYTAK